MADAPGEGLALRYALKRADAHDVSIAVAPGEVGRARLPDAGARTRFVAAILGARCGSGEELELLGESVGALTAMERQRLLARVGVLTPAVGLISNLNAWENIALPAAYHGAPPVARVAETATEVIAALGFEPNEFLACMPDDLGPFERKVIAFARLLAVEPELAVFDALVEGLSREECSRAARFEAEYRARHPSGALLFIDPVAQ